MIEALAQAACTTIQVEAAERGPSTVVRVQLPAGTATVLGTLGVRLNAIGFSARQGLVYGVDDDGRLVALDRAGKVVGTPTRPSPALRHARAAAVVGERLAVRVGEMLRWVDIDPRSGRFGHVVGEVWLWPGDGLAVDDFALNPANGLLYGVAAHGHHGAVVVSVNPADGKIRLVHGTGRLPGGSGYGAVALSPDGALYATNNRHGGRSTLWRIALDGSGVVTEVSSRQALHTIDSSGCMPPPPADPPRPTPTPTTTTTSPTTTRTTTTTTPPPAALPPPSPPPTTTTTTTPPTTGTSRAVAPPPIPPTPPIAMRYPEQRAEAVPALRTNVRDQRRWGLVALMLIVGAGAVARQAAARRR